MPLRRVYFYFVLHSHAHADPRPGVRWGQVIGHGLPAHVADPRVTIHRDGATKCHTWIAATGHAQRYSDLRHVWVLGPVRRPDAEFAAPVLQHPRLTLSSAERWTRNTQGLCDACRATRRSGGATIRSYEATLLPRACSTHQCEATHPHLRWLRIKGGLPSPHGGSRPPPLFLSFIPRELGELFFHAFVSLAALRTCRVA